MINRKVSISPTEPDDPPGSTRVFGVASVRLARVSLVRSMEISACREIIARLARGARRMGDSVIRSGRRPREFLAACKITRGIASTLPRARRAKRVPRTPYSCRTKNWGKRLLAGRILVLAGPAKTVARLWIGRVLSRRP